MPIDLSLTAGLMFTLFWFGLLFLVAILFLLCVFWSMSD